MTSVETPPIVVGVDFSDASRKAFNAAIQMAKDLGTTLVIAHSFPDLHAPSLMSGDMHKKIMDDTEAEISEDEAATLHEEWVSVARDADIDVIPEVGQGNPVDFVLAQAEAHKAGMIVVGTHGRTGLRRVLMGSVAGDVVKRSHIPVLVVPFRGGN